MLNKHFSHGALFAVAVSAALLPADPALAQHLGGGGGFHAGAFDAGGYYASYGQHGSYGYHPYRGYYGYTGYRPNSVGYYGGSAYPYSYASEAAYRDADAYGLFPDSTDTAGYNGVIPEQSGADSSPSAAPAFSRVTAFSPSVPSAVNTLPANAPARLTVMVPDGAQVWIDGTKTRSTGPVRHFESPPLALGHGYTYKVRVTWNEDGQAVTRTRTVSVSPGGAAQADFVSQSMNVQSAGTTSH